MTFLPIVARELRVAARRRGTYWLRTGVGAGIIGVSVCVFLMTLDQPPHVMGQAMFYVLTGGALLYCVLAGMRSTADCLSEEKREGTLGLLFLTDLKGYDVVSGKLVASSVNAFYGLLAVVPVLGVPLLLGGVTVGEFGRMAAVLVDALFLSLSVGLFASAVCHSWRKAVGFTFLLLLILTVGFPMLGAWVGLRGRVNAPAFGYFLPSAGYAYALALDTNFKTMRGGFYWSIGTIHALGWVFFGLASLVAPRSWQERPAGTRVLHWRNLWQGWGYGDLGERKRYRQRLLGRNAFFWLAARARLKPACVWAVLGLVGCGWCWGGFKYGRVWFDQGIFVATALVLNAILKSWFASEAGWQLSEDRKMGTMELLLSTPLTVRDILNGQWLALRRQFLGPFLAVLVAELAMMLYGMNSVEWGREAIPFWICLWSAGIVMLIADLAALYWLGLWMGLASRTPRQAFGSTVVRVLILPWVGWLGCVAFAFVTETQFRAHWTWHSGLGAWVALGLVADIGFGLWARHNLLARFREVAAQRYLRRLPLWKRLFGRPYETG